MTKSSSAPKIRSATVAIVISTVSWSCICLATVVLATIPTLGVEVYGQSEERGLAITIGLAALIAGSMGGLAQLFVIKLARDRWFYWFSTSLIGWVLGALLWILVVLVWGGHAIESTVVLIFLVLLPVSMIFAGFGQWLILRKYVARAWRWIAATAVSGLFAGIVGYAIWSITTNNLFSPTDAGQAYIFAIFPVTCSIGATGAIIGWLTGTAAVILGLHIRKPGTEVRT